MGVALRQAIRLPTIPEVCTGFVQMLRLTTSSRRRVAVGVSSVIMIPANKDRISFIVGQPSAGTIFFQMEDPAVANRGFALSATGTTAPFSLWDFGTMVTKNWFVIGSGAGLEFDVIETFLICP